MISCNFWQAQCNGTVILPAERCKESQTFWFMMLVLFSDLAGSVSNLGPSGKSRLGSSLEETLGTAVTVVGAALEVRPGTGETGWGLSFETSGPFFDTGFGDTGGFLWSGSTLLSPISALFLCIRAILSLMVSLLVSTFTEGLKSNLVSSWIALLCWGETLRLGEWGDSLGLFWGGFSDCFIRPEGWRESDSVLSSSSPTTCHIGQGHEIIKIIIMTLVKSA